MDSTPSSTTVSDSPRRGLYFEEFHEGQEFVTPARTITETDVYLFAGLTGDFNPLHTDAEAMKASQFGERIAHGILVLAIAVGLKARLGIFDGTAIAALGHEWRFSAPVRFGDTIRVQVKISGTRPVGARKGIITQTLTVLNQHDQVVQTGKQETMVHRRPDTVAG